MVNDRDHIIYKSGSHLIARELQPLGPGVRANAGTRPLLG
jgi:hypothetical protein